MQKIFLIIFSIAILFETNSYGQVYHGPMRLGLNLCSERIVLYAGVANGLSINSHLPIEKWEVQSTNGTAKIYGDGYISLTP